MIISMAENAGKATLAHKLDEMQISEQFDVAGSSYQLIDSSFRQFEVHLQPVDSLYILLFSQNVLYHLIFVVGFLFQDIFVEILDAG